MMLRRIEPNFVMLKRTFASSMRTAIDKKQTRKNRWLRMHNFNGYQRNHFVSVQDSEQQQLNFGHFGGHLQKFREVLNSLDEIRNLLGNNDAEIKIPSIVVIGDQSHGKSSLLELISGVALPRSQEICTKIPVELRLRAHDKDYPSVYIETCWHPKTKIEFAEISSTITNYTNELVPYVDDDPIILTIYDSSLPDLTMIDLPGLIHNDDSDMKINAIKNTVKRYIKSEQSIIVNVLNSTNESANAQSLKLSKEVDPKRERTLLVLTKIDLYEDEGLSNKFHTFITKEGFPKESIFLVRNRTEKENQSELPLDQVQENEKLYFKNRKDLNQIPDSCKGSVTLTKRLVDIQMTKMRDVIPTLKLFINGKIDALEMELESCIDWSDPSKCRRSIIEIQHILFTKLETLIKGRDYDINYKQQYPCSKSLDMFQSFVGKTNQIVNETVFESDEFVNELKAAHEKIRGFDAFPGEKHPSVKVEMYRNLVEKIEKPSLDLVGEMHDYLCSVVSKEIKDLTQHHPNLEERLTDKFEDVMNDNYQNAKCLVLDIIDIEKNTRPYSRHFTETKGSNHNGEVGEIEIMWQAASNRLCDIIPMIIYNKIAEQLITEQCKSLVGESLYDTDEESTNMMQHNADIESKIQRDRELLNKLQNSKKKLNDLEWF